MCRHAEDLAPMLTLLAGDRAALLQLERPVSLRNLKFYFLPQDGGFPLVSPLQSDLGRAQASLLQAFRDKWGVEVEQADLPGFYHSLLIWTNSMASEPTMKPFCAELTQVGIAPHHITDNSIHNSSCKARSTPGRSSSGSVLVAQTSPSPHCCSGWQRSLY